VVRLKKFKFILPINPSNNHYLNYRIVRKGKRQYVQPYQTEEYLNYQKIVIPYLKKLINKNKWEMIDEFKHFYLDLYIYFPNTNRDSSNQFKTLQDTCNNILWYDDKIILGRVMRTYYTYNLDSPPRIECELYPVEYVGIFKSNNEFNNFTKRCETCSKWRDGNCGFYVKYLQYKILKEFDVKKRECLQYNKKK
jgi:Holliday junction resolvase RusA-like endonuclease